MRPRYPAQNIYACGQSLLLDNLFEYGYKVVIIHLQKELLENLLVNHLQGLSLGKGFLNLYKISHSDKS